MKIKILKILIRAFFVLGIVVSIISCSTVSEGGTLLHWAAGKGYLDIVKDLISLPSVRVDARDKEGKTPLYLAADNNRKDAVKLLLEKGAEPSIPWPKRAWF